MNAEIEHTDVTALMHPVVIHQVAMTVGVMVVLLAMDFTAKVRINLVFRNERIIIFRY